MGSKLKSSKKQPKKTNISKSISNNSNFCNDSLSLNLSKSDITFTRSTLNSLHHLLYDETARKIFIEFSELEHSHNHILFWLEANEFKEKYIIIPPHDKDSKPEQQQTKSELLNNNVQSPNSNNSDQIVIPITNNESNSSTPLTPVSEQASSNVSTPNIINSGTPNNLIPISSDHGTNKVSRESSNSTSESDDEEDEIQSAVKQNMKNALYIFDKYLTPSSLLEVNLDFKTFIDIKKKIESNNILLNIFDKSQKEIFEVIYNDSFFRFKNSNTFKYLISCTENNSLSNSESKPIKPVKSSKSKRSFLCFA